MLVYDLYAGVILTAMSRENVEAFWRGVEGINRGDVEAIVPLTDPDVVYEPLRAATEGAYRGHDGIRRFAADTAEAFELFQVDFTDVRDLGERVLGIGTLRVRGRGSGIETEVPTAVVAEFRDGLLVDFKDYGDPRAALEAVGLRT